MSTLTTAVVNAITATPTPIPPPPSPPPPSSSADEMKSLGDDSLPIDVTRDERLHEAHVAHIAASQQAANRPPGAHVAPSAQEEDRLSPSHLDQSFAKAAPDNVEVKRTPVHAGFLVSFMVDARGGAMRGCRHSGVRVIIPPRRASMPMRVTCRFIRKEKLIHPPPLMEGEACAARVIEMGPAGAKFLGPVVIEVPHFASLRGKEREIIILRSDNGESWKEHTMEATEDAVSEVLNGSFDAQELSAMQDFNTNRVTRILTTDFPQYFAVVCRNRQEVHSIGPEGGMVSSTVVPQVQAIFPDGALTKKIKVGLQVNRNKKQKVDQNVDSHIADTETLSDDLSITPKRPKFNKYFSCLHSASPVRSLGEKRPSDSTTVDIHDGLVAPRKKFFAKTKTTAMRVETVESTTNILNNNNNNNNHSKSDKKSHFKPGFSFGRGKQTKVPVATKPAVERSNKDEKQGSSAQPIPDIELPVDNVSDVATVVCESPVKSTTVGCSTPRPIGDSVVEELAISLMTFLNEDKLTDEAEGSSQRKVTPEPSPARSLLAKQTPSKKRRSEHPSDIDEPPSSPKKPKLFRNRVLRKKKSRSAKKGKSPSPKPASLEKLAVGQTDKTETKSVRSETLEVPNIIKNTQSMESIDLNSETQSRKESATDVPKTEPDDVQNVSQKKGFLMRFGRHRVSSVVKAPTEEASALAGTSDRDAEQARSDVQHNKVSLISRLRRKKSHSDAEVAQDVHMEASPSAGAVNEESQSQDQDEAKNKNKKRAQPSDKKKKFRIFKIKEGNEEVTIAEESHEGEIEENAEIRTCEPEPRDEDGDAKEDKEEKSAKDGSGSAELDAGEVSHDSPKEKPTKKHKKRVIFSRFTIQRVNTDRQKKTSSSNAEVTESETSPKGDEPPAETTTSETAATAAADGKDEAKSEADTTANQDSGQGTSEPATSEHRDSEQSSRGFFSWFTGWRSVDEKIKEVPESCCDTTAEKSEAAKDLDPNTEADVSDIQSESESVTDECAAEKPADIEEQMRPKVERKEKQTPSDKDEAEGKPKEAAPSKSKGLLKRLRRKRYKSALDAADSGRGESSEGSRPNSAKTASRPTSASKLIAIFRKPKLADDTGREAAPKPSESAGTEVAERVDAVTSEVVDLAVGLAPAKDVTTDTKADEDSKKRPESQADNIDEPPSVSEKDSGYEPSQADNKAAFANLPSGRRKARRNRNRKGKIREGPTKTDVSLTEVAEEKTGSYEVRRLEIQTSPPVQKEVPTLIEQTATELKETKVTEVTDQVRDQGNERKSTKSPSPPFTEVKRNRRRRRGKKKSPTKVTELPDAKATEEPDDTSQKATATCVADAKSDEADKETHATSSTEVTKEADVDIKPSEVTSSSVDKQVEPTEKDDGNEEEKDENHGKVKKTISSSGSPKQKKRVFRFFSGKKSKLALSAREALVGHDAAEAEEETKDLSSSKTKPTDSNKNSKLFRRFRKSKNVKLPAVVEDVKEANSSKAADEAEDEETVQSAESPEMETAKSHQSESPKESDLSQKEPCAENKPQRGLISSLLQWSLGRTEKPDAPQTEAASRPSDLDMTAVEENTKEETTVGIAVEETENTKEKHDFRERVQSLESETQRSDTTSKFETPVEEFKPLVSEQKKSTNFFSNFGWPASLWTFGGSAEEEKKEEPRSETNADSADARDGSNLEATERKEHEPTERNVCEEKTQGHDKPSQATEGLETSEAGDQNVAKLPGKDVKESGEEENLQVENDVTSRLSLERRQPKASVIKLPKWAARKKPTADSAVRSGLVQEVAEAGKETAKAEETRQAGTEMEKETKTELNDHATLNEAKGKTDEVAKRTTFSLSARLRRFSLPRLSKITSTEHSNEKAATTISDTDLPGPVETEKAEPCSLTDQIEESSVKIKTEDEKADHEAAGAPSEQKGVEAGSAGEEKSVSEDTDSPNRTITIRIPLPKLRFRKKKRSTRSKKSKPAVTVNEAEIKVDHPKSSGDDVVPEETSPVDNKQEDLTLSRDATKNKCDAKKKAHDTNFLKIPKLNFKERRRQKKIRSEQLNKTEEVSLEKSLEGKCPSATKEAVQPTEEAAEAKKVEEESKAADVHPKSETTTEQVVSKACDRTDVDVDRPIKDSVDPIKEGLSSTKQPQKNQKLPFTISRPQFGISKLRKKSPESELPKTKQIQDEKAKEDEAPETQADDVNKKTEQADSARKETISGDDDMLTDRPTETPEPPEEKPIKIKRTFTINFAKFLSKGRDLSVEEARRESEKNRAVDDADLEERSPDKVTDITDNVESPESGQGQTADPEVTEATENISGKKWTIRSLFGRKSKQVDVSTKGNEQETCVASDEKKPTKKDIESDAGNVDKTGTEPDTAAKEVELHSGEIGDKSSPSHTLDTGKEEPKLATKFPKLKLAGKEKRNTDASMNRDAVADVKGDKVEQSADTEQQDKDLEPPVQATSDDEARGKSVDTEKTQKDEIATSQKEDSKSAEDDLKDASPSAKTRDATQETRFSIFRMGWRTRKFLKKAEEKSSKQTTDEPLKASQAAATVDSITTDDTDDTKRATTESVEAGTSGPSPAIEKDATVESETSTVQQETIKKDSEGRKRFTSVSLPSFFLSRLIGRKKEMPDKVSKDSLKVEAVSTVETVEKAAEPALESTGVSVPDTAADKSQISETSAQDDTVDEEQGVVTEESTSAGATTQQNEDSVASDITTDEKPSKKSWWRLFKANSADTKSSVKISAREEPSSTQKKFFRFSKKDSSCEDKAKDTLDKPTLEPVPEVSENEASKSEETSREEQTTIPLTNVVKEEVDEHTKEADERNESPCESTTEAKDEPCSRKPQIRERKFYAVFKLGRKVDSSDTKVKDKDQATQQSASEPHKKTSRLRLKNLFKKHEPAETAHILSGSKSDDTAPVESVAHDSQDEPCIANEGVTSTTAPDNAVVAKSDPSAASVSDAAKVTKVSDSPVMITKQDITIDAETGSVKIEDVEEAKSSPGEEKRDGSSTRGRKRRRNRNRKNNKAAIVRSSNVESDTIPQDRKIGQDSVSALAEPATKTSEPKCDKEVVERSFVEKGARQMVIESSTGEVTKIEVVSEQRVITKTTTSSTVVTCSPVELKDDEQASETGTNDGVTCGVKAEDVEAGANVTEQTPEGHDAVQHEQQDSTPVSKQADASTTHEASVAKRKRCFLFGHFRQAHKAKDETPTLSKDADGDTPDAKRKLRKDATLIDVSHSSEMIAEEITDHNAGDDVDKGKKKRYFKIAQRFTRKKPQLNASDLKKAGEDRLKENAQDTKIDHGGAKVKESNDTAVHDAELRPGTDTDQASERILASLVKRIRGSEEGGCSKETAAEEASKVHQNKAASDNAKDEKAENTNKSDEEESTVESTKNEGESSDSTELKDTSDEETASKQQHEDESITKAPAETKGTSSTRSVFGWLKGRADTEGNTISKKPNVSANGGDSSVTLDNVDEKPKKRSRRLFQRKVKDTRITIAEKKGFDNHGQEESAGASTSSGPKYDHFGRSYIFRWPGVRYRNRREKAATAD